MTRPTSVGRWGTSGVSRQATGPGCWRRRLAGVRSSSGTRTGRASTRAGAQPRPLQRQDGSDGVLPAHHAHQGLSIRSRIPSGRRSLRGTGGPGQISGLAHETSQAQGQGGSEGDGRSPGKTESLAGDSLNRSRPGFRLHCIALFRFVGAFGRPFFFDSRMALKLKTSPRRREDHEDTRSKT